MNTPQPHDLAPMANEDPGAQARCQQRIAALLLSRYNLRYMVRLYAAFEGDLLLPIVLGEVGLSLGRHAPHSLDELEDDYFDLIVTLAPEAHHAALELTRSMAVDVMYWPTPDPAVATGTRDQIMHSYREVREHLKLLIEKRLRGPG